jgi:hypothetical protein
MLLLDGISIGLMAGGTAIAVSGSSAAGLGVLPLVIGAGGYMVLSPMAHFGHDNPWTGRLSFAMRTLVPVTGMVIGANVVDCPPEEATRWCRRTKIGAAIGAAAGLLIWTAIDDGLLAKTAVPLVYATPTPDGGSVGFRGTF